jgi:hypothetical protein
VRQQAAMSRSQDFSVPSGTPSGYATAPTSTVLNRSGFWQPFDGVFYTLVQAGDHALIATEGGVSDWWRWWRDCALQALRGGLSAKGLIRAVVKLLRGRRAAPARRPERCDSRRDQLERLSTEISPHAPPSALQIRHMPGRA